MHDDFMTSCSFCKNQPEVLIIGPQVSICEECAKMAILQANEIKAEKMRRDSASDEASPTRKI